MLTLQDIRDLNKVFMEESERVLGEGSVNGWDALLLGEILAVTEHAVEKGSIKRSLEFIECKMMEGLDKLVEPGFSMTKDLLQAFTTDLDRLSLMIGNPCLVVSIVVEYRMKVQR